MNFLDNIKIICPECGTEQNLLIEADEWDNECFYCGYVFLPEDLCKALDNAGWKIVKSE